MAILIYLYKVMNSTLILNAKIVNEGKIMEGDLFMNGFFIEKIGSDLQSIAAAKVVDANGKFLLPGVIDDQVHFREPGLTHKATVFTESRAAVAGGVTSYMEMPNTVPPTFTQKLLEEKYAIAAQHSLSNYSFFIGASHSNLEEVLKTDIKNVCGLKIFMGSSTGNLLVDDEKILEGFFSRFPSLIATHCEHEPTIRKNTEAFRNQFGENIPISDHPRIRSEEACYLSSAFAVNLAKKHGTKLHILHISTAKEISLFDHSIPLEKKKITAEACVHHLRFSDTDYARLGTKIKWNPAIKTEHDRQAIWQAVLDNHIDVIATDHAPHTWEEKSNSYFNAPSGGPMVQYSLVSMLEFFHQKKIGLNKIVEMMSHHPAILFQLSKRGFIREGYFADLVLVDLHKPWTLSRSTILSKCGWSPLEGDEFHSSIEKTWVSGHLAYDNGKIREGKLGQRLCFDRP